LEVLQELHKCGQRFLNISHIILIDVDQFYGIECEEWPVRIAEVALWLMDHQMNMRISEEFGQYFVRLPLKKAAKIVHGNALRIDWEEIIGKEELSYILGNPPFVGKQYQTVDQKTDMKVVFENVKGSGVLDYVTAWYIKAAQYIQNSLIRVAFVSTNSVAQGEQVGILWRELLYNYGIKICSAHRTFKWANEARRNAAVHVVIIGFAQLDSKYKVISDYEDVNGEPHERKVKNINPYLVNGKDVVILARTKSICNVPEITYGSMANDGGNLLLSDDEKKEIVRKEPEAINLIKRFLGSYEFINGIKRWCIWLKDVPPNQYSDLKEIRKRINAVKENRLKSNRLTTRRLADFPMLFGEIRQPNSSYLLIPGVSSENRKYIPIGFLSKDIIASDLTRTILNADLFLFGIISSMVHMTWVKYICGRLKSDYRYSNKLVYNNFPWPNNPNEKNKKKVEKMAHEVIEARKEFPNSSLADLYDPLTMPPELVKAHQGLDKAVDLCYRPQAFTSEAARIEYLFDLYNQYVA